MYSETSPCSHLSMKDHLIGHGKLILWSKNFGVRKFVRVEGMCELIVGLIYGQLTPSMSWKVTEFYYRICLGTLVIFLLWLPAGAVGQTYPAPLHTV